MVLWACLTGGRILEVQMGVYRSYGGNILETVSSYDGSSYGWCYCDIMVVVMGSYCNIMMVVMGVVIVIL